MRWSAIVLVASVGCGMKRMLPEGPVQTPWERSVLFEERGAEVRYISEPQMSVPVLPVLIWGAAYDLDLVVVSTHPEWDMHEYARLETASGPVWLVKEARAGTLDQYLVADLPNVLEMMPELPLYRRGGAVAVADQSTPERIDIEVRYVNFDGHRVEMHFRGNPPSQRLTARNGSTMGHSRNQVLAVLDLPYRGFGRAELTVDGRRYPTRRLLGLVPFAMSLVQTQAGLAIGQVDQTVTEAGFTTTHALPNGGRASQSWVVSNSGPYRVARQQTADRTLEYLYLPIDGGFELASTVTWQFGRATPTSHIAFSPALPDVSRRFEGVARSRYVVDVNGQDSHAIGTVETWWQGDEVLVRVIPEEPWWTTDRPMLTTIRYREGMAEVRVVRSQQSQE